MLTAENIENAEIKESLLIFENLGKFKFVARKPIDYEKDIICKSDYKLVRVD